MNTEERSPLQGSNVVIFGGASGIGYATAELAKRRGANVTIVGRDRAQLDQAASKLGALGVAADIADRAQVAAVFKGMQRVDHLVITAGGILAGSVADTDPDVLLKALQVRIGGALYAVNAALPILSKTGSITLTGGQLSDRPGGGTAVMSAALRGIEGFARSLTLELQPIRVNVVSPGWTQTPLLDLFGQETKKTVLDQAAAQLPGKRIGAPEEIAEAFVFLMSNSYMNGEVLHVDGGGRLV